MVPPREAPRPWTKSSEGREWKLGGWRSEGAGKDANLWLPSAGSERGAAIRCDVRRRGHTAKEAPSVVSQRWLKGEKKLGKDQLQMSGESVHFISI